MNAKRYLVTDIKKYSHFYNPFLVYCRKLAPGTVSLKGDRAQGDDSKHDSHYRLECFFLILTTWPNW